MQANYQAEVTLGYAQSVAAQFDVAAFVSALTFQGQPAPGIPPGTVLLIITPTGQGIRWRDDGQNPTAAAGYPLAVGAELRYTARNMAALKIIGQAAGTILNVVAYGQGTP